MNKPVIKLVLADDEIAKLQKKLDIATKALKFYTLEDAYVSCFGNPVNPNPTVARKALKEIDIVGTSEKE